MVKGNFQEVACRKGIFEKPWRTFSFIFPNRRHHLKLCDQKAAWQTTPDFHYRHIIYDTKRSNSKDIFNPSNYDKYLEYNLFTMLRNPVDRMISEYYFMKDRAEFMNMLKLSLVIFWATLNTAKRETTWLVSLWVIVCMMKRRYTGRFRLSTQYH